MIQTHDQSLAHRCLPLCHSLIHFFSPGIIYGYDWISTQHDFCTFAGTMTVVTCYCSLNTIAAISIDRCVNICYHTVYPRVFTKKSTPIMCVCIWLLSFFVHLPNHFGWGEVHYDKKTLVCSFNRTASFSYTIFLIFMGIGIPNIITTLCYLKIFLFVRAQRKKISTNENSQSRSNRSVRLALTLFIIYVVFLCCWSPYMLVIFIDMSDTYSVDIYGTVAMLALLNSCVNTIIYGATNRNFRNGYIRLFIRMGCSHIVGRFQNDLSRFNNSVTHSTNT